MASKKKQKDMVFHQEGVTTPATAAGHPPLCCATPKPGKASEGGMEEAVVRGGEQECPAILHSQSDTLPPENICGGIKVTLENHSMWNVFFRCGTEMILTEQGSRMFPYCRFRISGLQPSKRYILMMDIQPLDSSNYKWTGKNWQAVGKAARHKQHSRHFVHPDSPAMAQHWMQSPVSFYRMKLTNNVSDLEGNIILQPMQRYLPRLHLVQTDKAAKDIKLNDPSVVTVSFPQTEFMAVLAYQNTRFVQLKVDYNPFAKGLKEDGSTSLGRKLKSNSGNPLYKPGGPAAPEQHPVKESLKSLLANHKPRNSKAADSKPSVPGGPQKTTDPHAAMTPGENLGSVSRPAQKLFSDLIREAHVSLQRCNLDQLNMNHSTSLRVEQPNTKNSTLNTKGQGVLQMDSASVKVPPRKSETKGKVKEDRQLLNSLNCKDSVRTGSSGAASPEGAQNSSEGSDHRRNPDATTEASVKQHRRPARLPLPALALFLKQHSKKTKSKQDSPPPAATSECLSRSLSSAAAARLPSECTTSATDPSKDLGGKVLKCDIMSSGCADPRVDVVLNISGQKAVAGHLTCPRTDGSLAPISESLGSEPRGPDGTPVFPDSDQPFCTLGASLTTSSSPTTVPLPLDTVLHSPKLPQTPPESSTLPLDSPTLKSSLPDPECSSLGFEPLSPASSPEPLPHLPASIALELDSTASEATCAAGPPEDLQDTEDPSVFKWHTVLPPPESFVDTSFTTFHPPPQTLSSAIPPLLPSQTPDDPDPQTPNTCIPTPAPHPPPSFQENEQSLPFPAELSPLALQLPLSPTFSSIDGDGLSPTPSLADLVQFLSADVDLGIGVEFSNTEAAAVPCSPTTERHEPSQQGHQLSLIKPCKRKNKKIRQRRLGKTNMQLEADDSTYRNMQPNLEEVEEQLFISFTSKEALKLHIADSSDRLVPRPQATPEGPRAADSPERNNSLDRNDEQINNLNPSKPSAESLEETIASFQKILLRDLKLMKHKQVIHPVLQEVGLKMTLLDPTLAIDLQYLGVHLPIPPPGASMATLSTSQGVSAAFVSRTGKTTDVTQIKGWREKFTLSETPPTPAACKPEAGSSSELQKKNLSAFCSDMLDEYLESEGKLIDERAASFSQPPVEPLVYELPTRSTSYVRTLDHILTKQSVDPTASDLISGFIPPSKRPRLKEPKAGRRGERKQKGPKQNKPRPELSAALSPESSPAKAQQPAGHNPMVPTSHPAAYPHPVKRRRRLKPRTSSQTLSPSRATSGVSLDLAPLESDSELGPDCRQNEDGRRSRRQPMTRDLLKQKVLEDSVVWEGQRRTSITTERATIALTSLFTQTGFVSENPTAPIQLSRRWMPPCLNEFCRLGCVCPGLSYCSRISHCGRPACMFGCSCLKQKVVLLKNLDGSDSSASSHQGNKKKKRRMKMAYVLKEADSVSEPAERVRILWRRDHGGSDPEPVNAPKAAPETRPAKVREDHGSCARVRGYSRKIQKWKEAMKGLKVKPDWPKPHRAKRLKKTFRLDPPPSEPPPSPPAELISKPSKRLFIMADFKWKSEADRSHVVMELCEAMARDRLDQPFWVRNYLICPTAQSVEGSGAERCIQYHVKISRPTTKLGKPAAPRRQVHLGRGGRKAEPLEEMQHKVVKEEVEPPEDWQRELEEGDITEEEGFTGHRVDDGKERSREGVTFEVSMALPFLTGISPAGFLSANRKRPGGTDQLIQVNGKLYPLAKIQLGKMGALHPANRLAAYLTGRVGSNRQQEQASLRPSSSSCNPPQTSRPTPPTVSSASSVFSGPAAIAATTAVTNVSTSTATTTSASTAVTPPKPVTPLTLPTTLTDSLPGSSEVPPVSQSLVAAPPKAPQVVLIQVPPPPGTAPVVAPVSSPQRMLLKPVQTASGVQFYRRPDGKLVQLVPISQLRPVAPALPVQKASTDVTVRHQARPLTTSTSLSVPVEPGSGFLSQKGTCTFKILSANSSGDPIIVTCAKVPPKPSTKVVVAQSSFTLLKTRPPNPHVAPVKLLSLKGSTVQGTEQGSKTVKGAMGGPLTKPAPPRTSPTTQTPTELDHPPQPLPPAGSAVPIPSPPLPPADVIGPEPEPARDPVDLDVICVDDEKPLATTETHSAAVTSSSETENSSDFRESESEDEKLLLRNNTRLLHVSQERLRRGKLRQLFDGLRRTVGLPEEKMSKVSTLQTAADVIRELRRTESRLKRKKRRLRKRRDNYLWSIAPSAGQTESMGAADQPDEPTIISSDEGRVVISDSDVEVKDDGRGAAVETVGEKSRLLRKSSEVEEETVARGIPAAPAALPSAVNDSNSPEEQLLEQARQVMQTLQPETKGPKSLERRDVHMRNISSNSRQEPAEEPGKSEQKILRNLQHLSSGQEETEEERRQVRNQLPARGRACRVGDESNESIMTSSDQQKNAHAPPTSVSSPPTPPPVQTPGQVLPSILASPVATHNPHVQRERPRTIPNILSRRKNPAPPVLTKSAEGEPSSFQALVPTDVLSLVGAALPGKPVLTLNPVTTGSAVLQPTPSPGVASVTLNIPTLTNQQIHLTSLPHPPAAPLTVTNLTASSLGSVLQLVQTNTPQQEAPPPPHRLLPAPPPLEVSAGSLQSADQLADQDQAPLLSDDRPASLSCQSTDYHLEREAGPPEPETRGDPENESLTSLLDELVFLNQQAAKQDPAAVGGAEEEEHSHSPWMLQLDSDSDTEGAGPGLHTEETQSSAEPELDNSKEGVLAPPPLLQMKVGGTKEASTSSSDGDGTVGAGGGGRMHGGVAWRPMPRLVPLGLRGHAPS